MNSNTSNTSNITPKSTSSFHNPTIPPTPTPSTSETTWQLISSESSTTITFPPSPTLTADDYTILQKYQNHPSVINHASTLFGQPTRTEQNKYYLPSKRTDWSGTAPKPLEAAMYIPPGSTIYVKRLPYFTKNDKQDFSDLSFNFVNMSDDEEMFPCLEPTDSRFRHLFFGGDNEKHQESGDGE
ncbi:1928_t:CDS:1 [Ambispora gerdemannii]|uniref:1928_t:CDS:1 n=1 Tax=Ambispora gerdemannii TaxID=144530 RepID=A0A9N8ZMA9_9GLOM|nr:1928_t:CDS:1 [Ambispora gerdemannii]